jgi:fructokinase
MADARPVVAIGECLIDLIAPSGDLSNANDLVIREGGAPANVAVALARLGVSSAYCGVVGDDPFGHRLRRLLEREGVDISRLRLTDEAETTLAFAWRDERGDGHFRIVRMADRLLSPAEIDAARLAGAEAIVVGSVALSASPSRAAIERAVSVTRDAGTPVVFDVNLRPSLWPDLALARQACERVLNAATIIKLSLDDARSVLNAQTPAEVFAALAPVSARAIVLTDGSRGIWMRPRGGAVVEVPPFKVEAVEPTGAGDAFTAALISRLVTRHWSGLDATDVRFAAGAGALATTRHGALAALPTRAELDAFLSLNGVRER